VTDYLYEKVGRTAFNGNATITSGSLHNTLNPSGQRFLEFLKAAVNHEFNGRGWQEVTQRTQLVGRSPVESTLDRQPIRSLTAQMNLDLPILCLYPTGGSSRSRTLHSDQFTTNYTLLWILGPLSPEDFGKLGGALEAWPRLIERLCDGGRHPAYDDGACQFDAGKIEWMKPDTSGRGNEKGPGLGEWAIGEAEFGEGSEGVMFHMAQQNLSVVEDIDCIPGYQTDAQAIDFDLGIVGPGGTLPSAIQGRTDPE